MDISVTDKRLFKCFANPSKVDLTRINIDGKDLPSSLFVKEAKEVEEESPLAADRMLQYQESAEYASPFVTQDRCKPFNDIAIRKFNLKSLKPDRIVLIVGNRGTGKNTLVEDILSHLSREFDAGLAMSPTPESVDMFRQYVPDSCIYEDYDGDKISEVIDTISKLHKSGEHPKSFVLLDDCMFDGKVLKAVAMKNLHYNGRHLKILFVNIMQYTLEIPKALRGQIDFVFALREPNMEYRKNLWKNFFGMFKTYDDFSLAMDTCTSTSDCLVMDNTVKSDRIDDCVFWYKAKVHHKPFVLGNEDFWKMHRMFYVTPTFDLDQCPIPALTPSTVTSQVGIVPCNGNSTAVKPDSDEMVDSLIRLLQLEREKNAALRQKVAECVRVLTDSTH